MKTFGKWTSISWGPPILNFLSSYNISIHQSKISKTLREHERGILSIEDSSKASIQKSVSSTSVLLSDVDDGIPSTLKRVEKRALLFFALRKKTLLLTVGNVHRVEAKRRGDLSLELVQRIGEIASFGRELAKGKMGTWKSRSRTTSIRGGK